MSETVSKREPAWCGRPAEIIYDAQGLLILHTEGFSERPNIGADSEWVPAMHVIFRVVKADDEHWTVEFIVNLRLSRRRQTVCGDPVSPWLYG